MALRTYIHVSDLHFGTPGLRNTVDPWLRYVPLLNGYVGEDPAALRYLSASVAALRRAEPNAELIVTGDLTAFGANMQFDRADEYLGLAGTFPLFLGLNFPHWRDLAVPGNHDHWPGIPFVSLGGNRAAVRARFPTHYVSPPVSLGNGRQLVFIHLDGDVDVKPVSPERFYAVGSFVSGLRQLENDPKLAVPTFNQVRVLLLHYSFEYVGPIVQSRWIPVALNIRHLSIDDASRAALAAFTQKYNVRVLLSGHVHNPFFVGDVPALAIAGRMAMEGRCGSTTQRIAPYVGNGHAQANKRFMNSFIVHRLEEDDAGTTLFWESKVHAMNMSGAGGFQEAAAFLTQPSPAHRIQVWP